MSRPASVSDARSPRRSALLRGYAPLRMLAAVALSAALLIAWRANASWTTLAGLWGIALLLTVWTLRADGGAKLIGPVCIYDLARLARRGRTRLLRCAYAILLLAWLAALLYDYYPQLSYQDIGQSVTLSHWQASKLAHDYVMAILSVQVAAVLVLTPAYLAGALAEEKERRTIELLFTTDLLDRELVLGKLFGRLLHLATILLVALPILSMTRLWGGVEANLLSAGFAVSILTMLSVGSLSLLCSVLARSVLGAVVSSYGAILVMNLWCLTIPIASPLLFVPEWNRRVDAEWKEWEDQRRSAMPVSGPPLAPGAVVMSPTPNSTLILLRMLIPYAYAHGALFLFCTITAIVVLRENCLARGEVQLRGVPETGTVTSAWGPLVEPASDLRRHPRTPASRLTPIREPALLWKEMFLGSEGFAGPPLREWLMPAWQFLVIVLAFLVGGSLLLHLGAHTAWPSVVAGVNVIIRGFSVLALSLWSLLLGFRVAGCISRERDQQTLESLLTLPVDREEILRAKWLGNILRYRQIGYVLGGAWAVGLALGALHPWALLLLVAACCVHLAFLASLGLWLSLASRTTLWANMNMSLVLLLLFSGSWLGLTLDHPVHETNPVGWLDGVLNVRLAPANTWWFVAFSWRDLTEAIQKGDQQFLRSLVSALMGMLLFGVAAWAFWQLSRRRFRMEPYARDG